MKHLVVTEGIGSISIKDEEGHYLTHQETDELEAHVRLKDLDRNNIIITRNEVKFINYVGYIKLSSCSIEILPKVNGEDRENSRLVLFRLLKKTGFLDIYESEISDLTLFKEDLLEILGYLFTKRLSKGINFIIALLKKQRPTEF